MCPIRCLFSLLSLLFWLEIISPLRINAQVTAANDGTGTSVTTETGQFVIRGGSFSSDGRNLFHSFQQFGLDANQIATFSSNPQIQNIFSRVTGGSPSVINGLIQVLGGNSNLFLMNPAGIVFGSSASLNVPASFTATTATGIGFDSGWFRSLGSNDYLSLIGTPNQFAFATQMGGAIANLGNLSVPAGQNLNLIGGTVINTGSLNAPGGQITLVSVPGGQLVRIQSPTSLISLELPASAISELQGSTPEIAARTLPELLTGGNLGNATGLAVEGDGTVRLTSSGVAVPPNPGTTIVAGKVDTRGSTIGGEITVVGDRVTLAGATLDASGVTGGGKVLIGGDYQGSGTTPQSRLTLVDANSTIRADALSKGDGGQVVVWSAGTTNFGGTISAQGGVQSGNGGLVETSGQQNLTVQETAIVSTRSSNGTFGTWLLDPTSITIVASGGADATVAAANANSGASTINNSTIVSALNGANVNLTATNQITVNAAIDASGNGSGGNLTLTAPTANLNQAIKLKAGSNLNGTATTVNVGASGTVQNGVDVVASGGTVNLATATYTLTNTVSISKNLTLNGAGAANTKVDGNQTVRVFNVAGAGTTATLNGITIQNGSATFGGGIFVNPNTSFSVMNSILANNSAQSGGGIHLDANSSVSLTNSTITNNSAQSGGGISLENTSNVSLTNSTLSNNSAIGGGGIALNPHASVSLKNSTLSNNSAIVGGGISLFPDASVSLTNSTIANNSATLYGGGISADSSSIVNLSNSIIANNQSPNGVDINGTVNSQGYNLIGNTTESSGFIASDLLNVNPLLSTLSNYGGSTQTLALLPGSPAINAGGSGATTTDQRGIAAVGTRDIGAFESQGFNLTITGGSPQTTNVTQSFTQPLVVKVTSNYAEPVAGGVINFSVSEALASASLSSTAVTLDNNGQASIIATANTVPGSYTVSAATKGASTPVAFALTNTLFKSFTIPEPPIPLPPNPGLPLLPFPDFPTRSGSNTPVILETPSLLPPGVLDSPTSPGAPFGRGAIGFSTNTFLELITAAKILDLQSVLSSLRIPQLIALQPETGLVVIGKTRLLNTLNEQPQIDTTLSNRLTYYFSNPRELESKLQAALPNSSVTQSILDIRERLMDSEPESAYVFFKRRLLSELQTDRDIIYGSLLDFRVGQFNLLNNLAQGNLDTAVSDLELLREAEFSKVLGKDPSNEALSAASIREILRDIVKQLGKKPAVLYSIALSDRFELLLITPEGRTIRKQVMLPADQLRQLSTDFFAKVTDSDSTEYLLPAQKLYNLLIRPLEGELANQGIDMILFSLDSGLRSIPIAALHDGKQFLVEKYSVGLIPSVSLTDTRYRGLDKARVLAMGASQFPQANLEPLPSVPTELKVITTKLWTGKSLLNEAFTLNNLKTQREGYEIVHLATHAGFQADRLGNPDAFIQLWDARLSPDQLRELGWKNSIIELLVLSACKTAQGNDTSELGFAGLAVRSGAKSALASLWSVSDLGTLSLMSEFYQHLKTEPIKAEALRQAQLAMLRQQVQIQGNQLLIKQPSGVRVIPLLQEFKKVNLSHPYYWSAFTMIGSPW